MSEFTIVSAGFACGQVVPALFFVIMIAAVFVGFIYYTSRMVFGDPHPSVKGGEAGTLSLWLLGLLLAALLVLGIYLPPPLQQCIQNAVLVLKG
jgi:hydrogenase-4 component F